MSIPVKRSNELLKVLTEEEELKLQRMSFISDFKRNKLEEQAQRNWEHFYKRNGSNFFKDRNWTKKELEFLFDEQLGDEMVFIEAGCGCGNTIFALAKTFPNWKLHGMDFSKNAIALLRQRSEESGISVGIEVADLTSDQLESNFPPADLISLIFILSSISKENHIKVFQNTKRMLKQGGSVIVRDYAANDHAMLRVGRNSRIGERFYARQDGTRAYYFFTDELRIIFEECGFQTAKCDYIYRRTENIKEKISIDRVFVEGRFVLK